MRLEFLETLMYLPIYRKRFGCLVRELAIEIIMRAKALGIRIKGLSFHVGSQTRDPQKYVDAIMACKSIMEQIVALGLPALSTSDTQVADFLQRELFAASDAH
ncbi:hypothetical protein P4S72_09605 [Vibrio sp. PP-XX7]